MTDRTGLNAKYDFKLQYAPETGPAPIATDDALPHLVTAIQEQLGLTLEPKKVSVDVLVIDGADKVPTKN